MKYFKLLYSIIPDLLLLIGFASLTYGLYQIYQPSMYVIDGIILLAVFSPKEVKRLPNRNNPKKRS